MTDHLDEGIDKHALVRIWVESHIIAQYQEFKIGHDVKMIADLDIVSSGYAERISKQENVIWRRYQLCQKTC